MSDSKLESIRKKIIHNTSIFNSWLFGWLLGESYLAERLTLYSKLKTTFFLISLYILLKFISGSHHQFSKLLIY